MTENDLKARLAELDIAFTRFEHEAAFTLHDCEHIGEEIGAKHCKNLFLTNRQQTVFYLLMLEPDKQFRTADVSKQLGVSRLSFAPPELLNEKLGLKPGAVSPLALIHGEARPIRVLMDGDLLKHELLCFHPLVNTLSYAMRTEDMLKFVRAMGNSVTFVEIA